MKIEPRFARIVFGCILLAVALVLIVNLREIAGRITGTSSHRLPDIQYLTPIANPDVIARDFPVMPKNSRRQVGFGVILYTLNTPWQETRNMVNMYLKAAENTGYPVWFQIDDWNFPAWGDNRTPLPWSEWTDWPEEGQLAGPLLKRRWFNWGSWEVQAPPPNYENAEFRRDLRERIVKGVAEPIAAKLKEWAASDRMHLFAGIAVGWESGFYTMEHVDMQNPPRNGNQVFESNEIVRTGYAALTSRGYTKESIAEEAIKRGMTETELFDELMFDVVHDYIEYIAKIFVEQGVPKDRVYTHISTHGTAKPIPAGLEGDGRLVPIRTAVNDYSRPGFTITHGWNDFEEVAGELKRLGISHWGAVEIEVVPGVDTKETFLEYMNRLSDHGARNFTIWGWWAAPGAPFAVKGTTVVEGMKMWLEQGGSL